MPTERQTHRIKDLEFHIPPVSSDYYDGRIFQSPNPVFSPRISQKKRRINARRRQAFSR